jgi:hypothetical protein
MREVSGENCSARRRVLNFRSDDVQSVLDIITAVNNRVWVRIKEGVLRALETKPRKLLTGHDGGNAGYS